MIYKSHYIELWVNGNLVELESQDSVNVRFNNVLSDPTKITSSQAEYSFEFELPCTPTNNKIFNYANDLAKLIRCPSPPESVADIRAKVK